MANAVEASAKAKEKRQRRVKHQQQEGTELIRGLSKIEKESLADSPKTPSSTARRGRENSPELGSPFLCSARQWDSDAPGPPARGFTLVLSRKARTTKKPGLGPLHQPWKTKHGAITLDLSTAGGPCGRGKTRRWPRKTSWQEDRQEGGPGGGRELRGGGDVPSRRVSPCTLLSYEGGCHSRWPQRRGEQGEILWLLLFYFFFSHPPFEQVPLYGEATLKSWGAVRLYALVCGMTNQPINK